MLLGDRLGASLNQSEVHDIAAGTDGWPAGVYVASLRLKMGMPPAEVIASLTNPDHTIQQYFDTKSSNPYTQRSFPFSKTSLACPASPPTCATLCASEPTLNYSSINSAPTCSSFD